MRFLALILSLLGAGPLAAATISYEQSTFPFAAYPASFGDVVIIEPFQESGGNTTQVNPSALSISGAKNITNGRLQRVAGNETSAVSTTLTFLQTRLTALAIFIRNFEPDGFAGNSEFVDVTFRDGGSPVETFRLTSTTAQNNGYYLITPSGAFDEVTFRDPEGAANAGQFNIDGIGGIEVVPLPAGLWVMLSGLGALVIARRGFA